MARNYDEPIAPMIKKNYILAVVSLLTIPVVTTSIKLSLPKEEVQIRELGEGEQS